MRKYAFADGQSHSVVCQPEEMVVAVWKVRDSGTRTKGTSYRLMTKRTETEAKTYLGRITKTHPRATIVGVFDLTEQPPKVAPAAPEAKPKRVARKKAEPAKPAPALPTTTALVYLPAPEPEPIAVEPVAPPRKRGRPAKRAAVVEPAPEPAPAPVVVPLRQRGRPAKPPVAVAVPVPVAPPAPEPEPEIDAPEPLPVRVETVRDPALDEQPRIPDGYAPPHYDRDDSEKRSVPLRPARAALPAPPPSPPRFVRQELALPRPHANRPPVDDRGARDLFSTATMTVYSVEIIRTPHGDPGRFFSLMPWEPPYDADSPHWEFQIKAFNLTYPARYRLTAVKRNPRRLALAIGSLASEVYHHGYAPAHVETQRVWTIPAAIKAGLARVEPLGERVQVDQAAREQALRDEAEIEWRKDRVGAW